jgi:hypothetical protein
MDKSGVNIGNSWIGSNPITYALSPITESRARLKT